MQGGAEFNFYFDAAATHAVIHSGLEITVILSLLIVTNRHGQVIHSGLEITMIGLEVANAGLLVVRKRALHHFYKSLIPHEKTPACRHTLKYTRTHVRRRCVRAAGVAGPGG